MGASSITEKGIRGEFFATLESSLTDHWVSELSFPVESNQGSQDNVWISAAPMMREWLGGRFAGAFWEDSVTIANKKFEGTLEVLADEIRRDKTGQVMLRVRALASGYPILWAQLITALVDQGETGIGYAGEPFFYGAHARGRTGAEADPQSNLLTYNVATPTAPTGPELREAIAAGVAAIMGFRDYEGELVSEDARHFTLLMPTAFVKAAADALPFGGGYTVRCVPNPWLSWSDRIAVFRADGSAKAFIRQTEHVSFESVAKGSELEFNEEKHRYGASASCNAGYGLWEHAALINLI
ncbi:MAG: Mu-like prophage major head subunit gpT family protein [Gammaproteobacteria bacterium]|nr:Mu-like prophage major head subunit gpT family protein [Gammaproteobacteria bacterium]